MYFPTTKEAAPTVIDFIIKYEFFRNAVIAGLLASVIAGIIGVIIANKKMVMMTGGIAHTAYGGVGLGYLLGVSPIIPAALFGILAAFIIGHIEKKGKANSDLMTAMLWSFGMALGILFVGIMPGYPPDLSSYLFGNILSVTSSDLFLMVPLALIILIFTLIFFADLKSYLFDEKFSRVLGLKTAVLSCAVLLFTALSVIALIRVAGIILVIALMSVPASCASLICRTLKGQMIAATIFGALFCLTGLYLSFYLNIASGATTVFVAVATYGILWVLSKLKK